MAAPRAELPWIVVSAVVAAATGLAAVLMLSALRGALPPLAALSAAETYFAAFLLGGIAGFLVVLPLNPDRSLWTAFCVASLMVLGTIAVSGYGASLEVGPGWRAALQVVTLGAWEIGALVAICALLLVGAVVRDRRRE